MWKNNIFQNNCVWRINEACSAEEKSGGGEKKQRIKTEQVHC